VLAGASAVSVGTATFGNPTAAITIRNQLEEICESHGFDALKDAIGFAHRPEGQEVGDV
jgi:dihydroorotate dehydrogenase (NAD+) catalytic subunit